jgi:hypothetical protein
LTVLRDQLDTESLLNLAQLSLEPLHDEEDAALLVQYVLRFEPGQPRAGILLAYLALHYWIIDEEVQKRRRSFRAWWIEAGSWGQHRSCWTRCAGDSVRRSRGGC